jgi:hypothetical protein
MILAVMQDKLHSAAPISTCDVSEKGFCLETRRALRMELPIYFRVLGPIANGVSGIASLKWMRGAPADHTIYGAEISTMSEADREAWAPPA